MCDSGSCLSAVGTLAVARELLSVPACLSFWYQLSSHPQNLLTVSTIGSPIWYRDYEQNMVWQRALVDLDLQQPEKDSNKDAKSYAVSYGFLKKLYQIKSLTDEI